MLGDTFVLPHEDGDITCTKINQDGYSAEYLYRNTTHEVRVKVRHSKVNATAARAAHDRHNVEIIETIFASGEVAEYDRKAYMVFEVVPGDTDSKLVDAMADWVISGTMIEKLAGWES
jgi:hypothetical protein